MDRDAIVIRMVFFIGVIVGLATGLILSSLQT